MFTFRNKAAMAVLTSPPAAPAAQCSPAAGQRPPAAPAAQCSPPAPHGSAIRVQPRPALQTPAAPAADLPAMAAAAPQRPPSRPAGDRHLEQHTPAPLPCTAQAGGHGGGARRGAWGTPPDDATQKWELPRVRCGSVRVGVGGVCGCRRVCCVCPGFRSVSTKN